MKYEIDWDQFAKEANDYQVWKKGEEDEILEDTTSMEEKLELIINKKEDE